MLGAVKVFANETFRVLREENPRWFRLLSRHWQGEETKPGIIDKMVGP